MASASVNDGALGEIVQLVMNPALQPDRIRAAQHSALQPTDDPLCAHNGDE